MGKGFELMFHVPQIAMVSNGKREANPIHRESVVATGAAGLVALTNRQTGEVTELR